MGGSTRDNESDGEKKKRMMAIKLEGKMNFTTVSTICLRYITLAFCCAVSCKLLLWIYVYSIAIVLYCPYSELAFKFVQ